MNRLRITIVAVVAATSSLAGPTGGQAASAAVDPGQAKAVLDGLCASKGGRPYFTPYMISRCQAARSNRGFAIERVVCEGALGGRFETVATVDRHNRTNWFCFAS